MSHILKLKLIVCLSALAACQSTGAKLTVEFDQNVTQIQSDGQEKPVNAGIPFVISAEPTIFLKNNRKTLILLPLLSPDGRVSIRLPKEKAGITATDERTPAERGQDANDIAQAIVSIQLLISERRADEALLRIEMLRSRFQNFSYLGFMEASCFILKKELSKAKEIVEMTLREFPDDVLGRKFIESLKLKK